MSEPLTDGHIQYILSLIEDTLKEDKYHRLSLSAPENLLKAIRAKYIVTEKFGCYLIEIDPNKCYVYDIYDYI